MFSNTDLDITFNYTGALWMLLGSAAVLIVLGLVIVGLSYLRDRALDDSK